MRSLRHHTLSAQFGTQQVARPRLQLTGTQAGTLLSILPISRCRCRAGRKNVTSTSNQDSKPSDAITQAPITPAEYMAPFSAVDPRMHSSSTEAAGAAASCPGDSSGTKGGSEPSSSSSSSSQEQQPDKWGETLAVNHTLSSLYLRKVEVCPVVRAVSANISS
jgi:hypothetical protein